MPGWFQTRSNDEIFLSIQVFMVFIAALAGVFWAPMWFAAPFVGVWMIIVALRIWCA